MCDIKTINLKMAMSDNAAVVVDMGDPKYFGLNPLILIKCFCFVFCQMLSGDIEGTCEQNSEKCL